MPSTYPTRKELQDRIAQLDAILANSADQVPTDIGPVRYNLMQAEKERARLEAQINRLDRNARRTRMIAVYPTRS